MSECHARIALGYLDGGTNLRSASVPFGRTTEFTGQPFSMRDACPGLKAALRANVHGVAWQRCLYLLHRDALAYSTKHYLKSLVAVHIRAVFNAPSDEVAMRLLAAAVEQY